MATFKSNIVTADDAALTGLANGVVNGDDKGGLLLKATAIYTLLGTESATDTIDLINLPAGCVVEPSLSTIVSANPGTALVLDVGDDGSTGAATADPDRYADGAVLSSGGEVKFNSAAVSAANATPYRSTGRNKVFATFMTATSLTPGVKVVFNIVYRVKG